MEKKYVVCPGYVLSLYDGTEHYISAGQLISLYGVNSKDCIIYDHNKHEFFKQYSNLKWLYPRLYGDYRRIK